MHTEIKVNAVIECDGSSIWGNTKNKKVKVNNILVETFPKEDEMPEGHKMVYVDHDSNSEIYTDRGFEKGISKILGYDVFFTEQGMQEDNRASMET